MDELKEKRDECMKKLQETLDEYGFELSIKNQFMLVPKEKATAMSIELPESGIIVPA